MPYTLILFAARKPGLALDKFKAHWEHTHIPLLKSIVGDDFPLSYTRHYVERDTQLPNAPAHMLFGAQEDVRFDGMGVLTFIDRSHYERFEGKLRGETGPLPGRGYGGIYGEDLNRFVDGDKFKGVFMGDSHSSGRDGGVVGWRFVGSV